MKTISIIDEEYVDVETAVIGAISDTKNRLKMVLEPFNTNIDCVGVDLKFCPEYINLKAVLEPIIKVNHIIRTLKESFALKVSQFTLQEIADMSIAFKMIFKGDADCNVADGECSILSLIDILFGGYGGIDQTSENSFVVNEQGMVAFNHAKGKLNEVATTAMANMNLSVNSNNVDNFLDWCKKIVMMDFFATAIDSAIARI